MIHVVYGTTDTPHIVVIKMISDVTTWVQCDEEHYSTV